jgi:hypothetical protein
MAYRNDGSVHHEGIENENNVATLLQDPSYAQQVVGSVLDSSYSVATRGGTQYKEDVVILDSSNQHLISVKRKKSLKTGSFDYINSSSAVKNTSSLNYFAQEVDRAKTCTSKSTARKIVNEASNTVLNNLTSKDVWNILHQYVILPYKNMITLINDQSTKKSYAFGFEGTQLFNHYQDKSNITLAGKGKSSRKILFNGEDIGLRIRVVTNNGIGALLGLSKKNKTSIPVVKIQQDKVHSLVENTKNVRTIV